MNYYDKLFELFLEKRLEEEGASCDPPQSQETPRTQQSLAQEIARLDRLIQNPKNPTQKGAYERLRSKLTKRWVAGNRKR